MRYDGDVLNGIHHGKGIYMWKNGDRYEGEFANGDRDGTGIMYYNNGIRYEGQYHQGERHGTGILYLKNGVAYHGNYIKDKRNGGGEIVYPSGEVVSVTFKDNKIQQEATAKFQERTIPIDLYECNSKWQTEDFDFEASANTILRRSHRR
jgi:hypothetical protein